MELVTFMTRSKKRKFKKLKLARQRKQLYGQMSETDVCGHEDLTPYNAGTGKLKL